MKNTMQKKKRKANAIAFSILVAFNKLNESVWRLAVVQPAFQGTVLSRQLWKQSQIIYIVIDIQLIIKGIDT